MMSNISKCCHHYYFEICWISSLQVLEEMELPIYQYHFLTPQIPSLQTVKERLFYYATQYNELIRGGGLDLVFFKDAITHLIKVRTGI